jgi:hypothetical protein
LSKELRYDPKWLAILRKTSQLEVSDQCLSRIPERPNDFMPTKGDIKQVERLFDGDFRIPLNFRTTAPPENVHKLDPKFSKSPYYRNPQTKEFCEKLKIPDLNEQLCLSNMEAVGDPHYLANRKFLFFILIYVIKL